MPWTRPETDYARADIILWSKTRTGGNQHTEESASGNYGEWRSIYLLELKKAGTKSEQTGMIATTDIIGSEYRPNLPIASKGLIYYYKNVFYLYHLTHLTYSNPHRFHICFFYRCGIFNFLYALRMSSYYDSCS